MFRFQGLKFQTQGLEFQIRASIDSEMALARISHTSR